MEAGGLYKGEYCVVDMGWSLHSEEYFGRFVITGALSIFEAEER
jgi:hypothetical protein